MKALFVNGSPRKNWNTYNMLESAMKGAADAGAETELVSLYDNAFKGCISCFACKIKNSKTNGLCAFKDALTPILEKALAADVIVIGSPIYFSDVTGPTRSFMERFGFPLMTYLFDETGKQIKVRDKVVPTGMIFTMNCTEEFAPKIKYTDLFNTTAGVFGRILGYSEYVCAYNTYQFSDYSRYDFNMMSVDEKNRQREEQFPKDLENAYNLGKRLVEKAR